MQKDSSISDSFTPTSVTADNGKSTQHLSRNPFLSPVSLNQFDQSDFVLFPNSNSVLSVSSSGYSSFDDDVSTTDNRLQQASFVLEYRQLYNRYTLYLGHLQETLKEVDALRRENQVLRSANADLVQRLSVLSQTTIQNCLLSSTQPALSLINDFNRLNVEGTVHDTHVTEETSSISPTSVIEHNRFERRNIERVLLPKSISVRSSDYLNMKGQEGSNGGPSSHGTRDPLVPSQSISGSQKVCVPGGKTEEEALEFEVYNQGMFKTELCNKWQETGACPYGENCQFAHGITELRPVIRHPRYKTEVCRVILAGDICPYGHRCHFRHSLTEQERLLAPR